MPMLTAAWSRLPLAPEAVARVNRALAVRVPQLPSPSVTMPLQTADTLFEGTVPIDTAITRADLLDTPEVEADTSEVSIAEATSEAVDTVQGFVDGFFATLPRLAIALVMLGVFWLVAKGVRSAVRRLAPGPNAGPVATVLGRLAYAGILLLGTLVALVVLIPGFSLGELVGALGIGGIAIGFAFQDIFQNLLAGVLILLRQPFGVGDEITSGTYTGTVEAIETRATFIRTYDGRRVIIPNSQIYSEPVTVITAYGMVRSQYDVGIGYGDDIDLAKRIALETVKGIEGILNDPVPDVITWDLAGSSVNLRVRWWSDPKRANVVKLRDAVLRSVSQALLAEGIDLPFPTQQILWHDQTEATDGDRTRQREGWPVPRDGKAPKPRTIAGQLASGDSARTRGEAESSGDIIQPSDSS